MTRRRLLGGLWLVAAAPLAARPTLTTPIQITSITPKSVVMAPGQTQTLRFLGQGFESIYTAQILRQDVRLRNFGVTWTLPNPNAMDLTLSPAQELPAASDYRLVLFTRRFSLWVPLRIELADPRQAPDAPAGEPEPLPQPSGWFNPGR